MYVFIYYFHYLFIYLKHNILNLNIHKVNNDIH